MTHSTAHNRTQLETLWQSPAVSSRAYTATPQSSPQFSTLVRRLGQELLAFMTGSQTLRIWTKSTRQGVVWFAYDPTTGQRIGHCSEDALRIWLESRHR